MFSLRTEIRIDAAPERLWRHLAELDAYPEWNPLVREASGRLEPGSRLQLLLHPEGGRPFRISPTVLVAEPGRELRWRGRLGLPGIFDGEHVFRLESDPDGTGVRLVHEEYFSGLLVPFLRKMLDTTTKQAFLALNEALKARAEGTASPSDSHGSEGATRHAPGPRSV